MAFLVLGRIIRRMIRGSEVRVEGTGSGGGWVGEWGLEICGFVEGA